jgi:hypothetical protein
LLPQLQGVTELVQSFEAKQPVLILHVVLYHSYSARPCRRQAASGKSHKGYARAQLTADAKVLFLFLVAIVNTKYIWLYGHFSTSRSSHISDESRMILILKVFAYLELHIRRSRPIISRPSEANSNVQMTQN